VRAFGSVSREWNHLGPHSDLDTHNRLAKRCLDVNRQFPGTAGGLSALLLAASNAPQTPAGQDANRQFAQQIETADLGLLAWAFKYSSGRLRAVPQFAAPLLVRVRRTPDHLRCGQLLAECCAMTRPQDEGEPPAVYQEAADLLADRYAGSPEIQHFPEGLAGVTGSPPWAVRYERHLRAILDANHDRAVRCAAEYALASVVLSAGDDRQAESEALFKKFCADFDGTHSYRYQGIEQQYLSTARLQLKELQFHAAGKPASEIDGVDLDDRPLKLSDYHGRVVLLNFWGTWCFPCMKLVPHERELAAAYRGRPFDIVGVNCDDDGETARAAGAGNPGSSGKGLPDRPRPRRTDRRLDGWGRHLEPGGCGPQALVRDRADRPRGRYGLCRQAGWASVLVFPRRGRQDDPSATIARDGRGDHEGRRATAVPGASRCRPQRLHTARLCHERSL
jgi:thiol-disulfide isomerase/thioredoxin